MDANDFRELTLEFDDGEEGIPMGTHKVRE